MINPISKAYNYVTGVESGKIIVGNFIKLAVKRFRDDLERATEKGIVFEEESAQKALDFFELLRFTKGKWKGQPFSLEPWQAFIVANIFGWKRLDDGNRRFTEVYIEIPKKNGKALALDTPIPTPYGWSTMGDLKVGDQVFDETGKPCNVTFVTNVMHNRQCYEVVFSDGIKIIADAEHQWETLPYINGRGSAAFYTGKSKKEWHNKTKEEVFTTEQLKNTLHFKMAGVDVCNHRIATTGAVGYHHQDLPIAPYLLGFWLGDGNSRNAKVTIGDKDIELIKELEKFTVVKESVCCRQENAGGYLLGDGSRVQASRNVSIQARLRTLNLLNNKHIPDIYLTADIESRRELLKGLMDTDGYVSKAGQCEFATTKEPLYVGFMELARSLGYKPSVKIEDSFFQGILMGKKYRIQFWAFADEPCFKLQRKIDRLKPGTGVGKRYGYRQIVAINAVDSVPVKCIQVDSPKHLYLCSEGFVPTHNTELAAGIGLLMLIMDDENTPEVYAAAATRDQAGICFKAAKSMARQSEYIRPELDILTYNLYCDYNEGSMSAVSHDADNTEGKHSSCVLFDEYHVHKSDDVKTSLRSGMAAREQPLFFTITTSGANKQGPCYKYRDGCISVLKGSYDRDNMFALIYTLDEGDNWEDPEMWKKANPNYGVSVRPQFLLEEFAKAKKNGREEVEFKTKHLDLWVDADVTWIPSENWVACADPDFIPPRGAICYGGIDLGNSNDISSFALYFPDYKYIKLYHYVAKEAAEYAARGGIDYNDWINDEYLCATEGKTTDYEFIKNDIFECAENWEIRFIGMDPNHGQLFYDQVADRLGVSYGSKKNKDTGELRWGNHSKIEKFSQAVAAFNSPTRMFEDMVTNGEIRHDGNPVTSWMLGNVSLVTNHLNQVKPAKDRSKDKIDGIIAIIMALGEFTEWHHQINSNKGVPAC